jgi:sulfur transfer protein SufE
MNQSDILDSTIPKSWDEHYKLLIEYKQKYKTFRTELCLCDGDKSFQQWVNNQRSLYKHKKLSKERTALLNSIGFFEQTTQKDQCKKTWDKNYRCLIEYKQKHNSFRIELRLCDGDRYFREWVYAQTSSYKKKILSKERIALLSSIGFFEQTYQKEMTKTTWDENYRCLIEYKKKFNSFRIFPEYCDGDKPFIDWIHKQRRDYRNKELSKERKVLLDSIGFV